MSASAVSGVNAADVKAKADTADDAAQIANAVAAAMVQVTLNAALQPYEAAIKDASPATARAYVPEPEPWHPFRSTSAAFPRQPDLAQAAA